MKNTSFLYHLQFSFFVILFLFSLVLLFLLFKPFLGVLFFALTLAVIFEPVHKRILNLVSRKETLASIISVTLILFLILIPLIFIAISLFQETVNVYSSLTVQGGIIDKLNGSIYNLENYLRMKWPQYSLEISNYLEISEYLKQGMLWVVENTSKIFSSFVRWFLGLFLMALALFYFFKDGRRLEESFVSLSPLSAQYSEKVLHKIKSAINSVIRGRLLVGIIQGILTTLAFALFSVPNPVFWGVIAAIFSVLPVVGPLFVIVPAALYSYFITGSLLASVGLIVWGIASVLIFDEYLGSVLIDRGLKIHPFLILLSILGGLALFGPVGFVLGPVSLSLFFALLEIYPLIVLKN